MFCIKSDEFLRKVKSNQDSYKTIILMALAKQKAILSKVQRMRGILHPQSQ